MEEPGFWDDPERSTRMMKEAKNLKDTVEGFQKLETQYEEIGLLIDMGYEENDPEVIPEIRQMLEEFEEELEYKIVGSTEANSLKGKISNESPVGKALIGSKVGDRVQVETQAGIIEYKVLEIQRSN